MTGPEIVCDMTDQPQPKQGAGMLIAFLAVVVIAPLVGAFAFSPLLVAWGLQPYQLAAAIGVMFSEAVTIFILAFLVQRSKS
jgi:hypothetical protein